MIHLDENTIERLLSYINNADNVVITAHMSPDGDAMGSSLAMYRVMKSLGKVATVVVPDDITKQLSFLPGFKDVLVFCRNKMKAAEIVSEAKLIFCLDYNDFGRIDQMAPLVEMSDAKKVMIDHHLNPSDKCDITISYPDHSSTCALLYDVLTTIGLSNQIDSDTANCILTGMMTDTGNFSYNANDPDIYPMIGDLLRKGADKNMLTRKLFDTFTESYLRINAYAIYRKMKIFKEYGAALITLTRDELNIHHYTRGDTEGLVNKPLAIPGIVYSVFLREEERYIKVSMRSIGDFPCDEICSRYFNGGGHLNAAGGEFSGSMQQAIDVFESILPVNKKHYIEKK